MKYKILISCFFFSTFNYAQEKTAFKKIDSVTCVDYLKTQIDIVHTSLSEATHYLEEQYTAFKDELKDYKKYQSLIKQCTNDVLAEKLAPKIKDLENRHEHIQTYWPSLTSNPVEEKSFFAYVQPFLNQYAFQKLFKTPRYTEYINSCSLIINDWHSNITLSPAPIKQDILYALDSIQKQLGVLKNPPQPTPFNPKTTKERVHKKLVRAFKNHFKRLITTTAMKDLLLESLSLHQMPTSHHMPVSDEEKPSVWWKIKLNLYELQKLNKEFQEPRYCILPTNRRMNITEGQQLAKLSKKIHLLLYKNFITDNSKNVITLMKNLEILSELGTITPANQNNNEMHQYIIFERVDALVTQVLNIFQSKPLLLTKIRTQNLPISINFLTNLRAIRLHSDLFKTDKQKFKENMINPVLNTGSAIISFYQKCKSAVTTASNLTYIIEETVLQKTYELGEKANDTRKDAQAAFHEITIKEAKPILEKIFNALTYTNSSFLVKICNWIIQISPTKELTSALEKYCNIQTVKGTIDRLEKKQHIDILFKTMYKVVEQSSTLPPILKLLISIYDKNPVLFITLGRQAVDKAFEFADLEPYLTHIKSLYITHQFKSINGMHLLCKAIRKDIDEYIENKKCISSNCITTSNLLYYNFKSNNSSPTIEQYNTSTQIIPFFNTTKNSASKLPCDIQEFIEKALISYRNQEDQLSNESFKKSTPILDLWDIKNSEKIISFLKTPSFLTFLLQEIENKLATLHEIKNSYPNEIATMEGRLNFFGKTNYENVAEKLKADLDELQETIATASEEIRNLYNYGTHDHLELFKQRLLAVLLALYTILPDFLGHYIVEYFPKVATLNASVNNRANAQEEYDMLSPRLEQCDDLYQENLGKGKILKQELKDKQEALEQATNLSKYYETAKNSIQKMLKA